MAHSGFVEITEQEFLDGRTARAESLSLLAIEEKMDIVIENFVDLEEVLLRLPLRHSVFHSKDWSAMMSDLQRFNRALANLLTTARLYIDQTKHDVSMLFGNPSKELDALKALFSREYDARLGYRVMEAVRNYMQHRSLPIHGIRYLSNWEPAGAAGERLRFRVLPWFRPSTFNGDPAFKQATCHELEPLGEKVTITPFVRQYVEGLGRVHERFRDLLSPIASRSDGCISELMDRAKTEFGEEANPLTLVQEDDQGSVAEEYSLFSEPIQRRVLLQRKNRSFEQLSARYVASSVE